MKVKRPKPHESLKRQESKTETKMKTHRSTQTEAQYRVALKRILRVTGVVVESNATTAEIERRIKALAKIAPKIVALQIHQIFVRAARAWERGNNSGDNATLDSENENCDRLRELGERILKIWGVAASYPGLYPVFTVPGHFNDRQFFGCESVLWVIVNGPTLPKQVKRR